MAVVNAVVTNNASSVAADIDIGARFIGGVTKTVAFSFEVAAADEDGSIYRFARLPINAIVTSIKLISDAIAGATDYDIGVYKPLEVGGAVVDKDCLLDGADINAGKSSLTEMLVPTIADVGKPLYVLAGKTEAESVAYGSFDVAFTGNTVGTAAGTLSGFLTYIDGL